jgi:hypothetical protein
MTMSFAPDMRLWVDGSNGWTSTSTQAGLAAVTESGNTTVVTKDVPYADVLTLDPGRGEALAPWVAILEGLSRLAPGWNRHGAPAPSKAAIRQARQLIEAMVKHHQPPTRVAASAVGGVGITRRLGNRMAYIEFYNNGAGCALLTGDEANEAEERLLDVGSGAFKDLLSELKAYLNG